MSREIHKDTKSSEQQATTGESTTATSAGAATAQQEQSNNPPLPHFAGQSVAAASRSTLESELKHSTDDDAKRPAAAAAKSGVLPSESASQSTDEAGARPRQVIAVSASKGPAAFFNLARKFLITDEMCDLSALEGAIVSAVDAAHLLERSKLATIVRIQTSYVTVEPKRRKPVPSSPLSTAGALQPAAGVASPLEASQGARATVSPSSPGEAQTRRTSTGRELRRARIVITVKRTDSYKKWLDENPLQAIIAGDTEEDAAVEAPVEG
mmetsp:Transcript_12396/g.34379  ORF Transcript_12396/g.34379 Transcript_12396/m.34379 type:complete len:268 (+) Transcript_12396:301-1104(+)|eukprot:CAMPEP_0168744878 /NCGR_PEP_ID=MMETSP0724-20121128/14322_1 /TAXON_ID=265536 /ORGANISM="Amphiprora sp., Strain CCMP467" /LENGTH=267 /DNA_ID=CAMNT_0008792559 /DNA_START=245 /DNA_END=1048 /DNA_ORIENTATION=+